MAARPDTGAIPAGDADRQSRDLQLRRGRDRSLVLTVVAILLLLPPFAKVLHVDVKVGGVPVTLVYLFVVWAGLIVLARGVARSLSPPRVEEGEDPAP